MPPFLAGVSSEGCGAGGFELELGLEAGRGVFDLVGELVGVDLVGEIGAAGACGPCIFAFSRMYSCEAGVASRP